MEIYINIKMMVLLMMMRVPTTNKWRIIRDHTTMACQKMNAIITIPTILQVIILTIKEKDVCLSV